jgi:hypothetical protein
MTGIAEVRSDERCVFLLLVVHRALVTVNAFHLAGAIGVTVFRVLENYLIQLTRDVRNLPRGGRTRDVALFAKRLIERV